jgi:hypothetical protein
MMEKNGNTLAPGDRVNWIGAGQKQASEGTPRALDKGEVLDVDTDEQTVLVKFANSQRWVPLAEVVPT